MFEVRLQTYWADVDAAGIVHFPHFFKFAEHAEEEMFRAAGMDLQSVLKSHEMWLPRVEAFSKFSKPIPLGGAIRVRLNPQLKGEKTIRYNFEIVSDTTTEKLAEGYITVVCVDASTFKSVPLPDAIRSIIARNA
ncbi:MAG TPA: thioesterase family protein [Terriglobia bacterium]|jgi:acyl-CoA thioester hydrolase